MSRFLLTTDLKDDPAVIAEYKAHHRRVWPEVAESLRLAGILEMEIHLLGRRLVMVVETDNGCDLADCFAAHVASSPRVVEWERLMKAMQVPPPGAGPGEWWAPMERIFRLDAAPEPARTTSETARRS